MERENSVKSLKTTPFERRTFEEKFRVKEPGRDQPYQQSKTETRKIIYSAVFKELGKKRCTLGPGGFQRLAT